MSDDVDASLDCLMTTVSAKIEDRKRRRAEAWADLKARAPEHAELIAAVSSAFGKPEWVRVKLAGKLALDSKAL